MSERRSFSIEGQTLVWDGAGCRPATNAEMRMWADLRERDERIAGLERERDELRAALGNLLAVIHHDGGQYLAEHGLEKACADAEQCVHAERGALDDVMAQCDAAERERDAFRQQAQDAQEDADEFRKESHELEDKLREIEAQEPVAEAILVGESRPFWDIVLLDAAGDPSKLYPGAKLYTAPVAPRVALPDVDALANIIRAVDGNHSLGAGALAEAIIAEIKRECGQ